MDVDGKYAKFYDRTSGGEFKCVVTGDTENGTRYAQLAGKTFDWQETK